MFRFVFILIFFCGRGDAFEVRFYESYPNYRIASDLDDVDSMRLHKREMQQFFDKGFQKCFVISTIKKTILF